MSAIHAAIPRVGYADDVSTGARTTSHPPTTAIPARYVPRSREFQCTQSRNRYGQFTPTLHRPDMLRLLE